METLLGRGCRRQVSSRLLVLGRSGDVVQIAAGQVECSKCYKRLDCPMGSSSPGQSHGHLLASKAQPCLGTASRVKPSPVALRNANAIYMCYKSPEQIGRVA